MPLPPKSSTSMTQQQLYAHQQLKGAVNGIEDRYLSALAVEKAALELHAQFSDVRAAVDEQQPSLDVVDKRLDSTKESTEQGLKELELAEKEQKKKCTIL